MNNTYTLAEMLEESPSLVMRRAMEFIGFMGVGPLTVEVTEERTTRRKWTIDDDGFVTEISVQLAGSDETEFYFGVRDTAKHSGSWITPMSDNPEVSMGWARWERELGSVLAVHVCICLHETLTSSQSESIHSLDFMKDPDYFWENIGR